MLRLRLHVARATGGGRGAVGGDHTDALESGTAAQERPAGCARTVRAALALPGGTAHG